MRIVGFISLIKESQELRDTVLCARFFYFGLVTINSLLRQVGEIMSNYVYHWPRAMGLSCLLHIGIVIMAGWMLGHMSMPQPAERYVAINVVPGTPITAEQSSYMSERQWSEAPAQVPEAAKRSYPQEKTYGQPGKAEGTPGVATGKGMEGSLGLASTENGILGGMSASSAAVGGTAGNGQAPITSAGSGRTVNLEAVAERFLMAIEQHKVYPYIARKRQQEGMVLLSVSLGAGGELKEVSILASSGFNRLDEAAVAVVRDVCPFPHGAGQDLVMRIPITYQLKE